MKVVRSQACPGKLAKDTAGETDESSMTVALGPEEL